MCMGGKFGTLYVLATFIVLPLRLLGFCACFAPRFPTFRIGFDVGAWCACVPVFIIISWVAFKLASRIVFPRCVDRQLAAGR